MSARDDILCRYSPQHRSTIASAQLKPDGLLLMAPAFGLPDYPNNYPTPVANQVAVVHGWHDDVVPVENAIIWARQHNVGLVLVDDNHSLHNEVHTVGQLLVAMLNRYPNLRDEVLTKVTD